MSLLEAHVAGAQLVASDIAVHREVAARVGPAAELVPLSATPAGLAAAIRRAAAAPRPQVSEGSEVSVVPSWDDHVAALLGLYTQSSS